MDAHFSSSRSRLHRSSLAELAGISSTSHIIPICAGITFFIIFFFFVPDQSHMCICGWFPSSVSAYIVQDYMYTRTPFFFCVFCSLEEIPTHLHTMVWLPFLGRFRDLFALLCCLPSFRVMAKKTLFLSWWHPSTTHIANSLFLSFFFL